MGHVQIQILGTTFAIQADEDPEYLTRLVDYLGDKVQEIEQTVSTRDPLRISILAGILVADELFKDRERLRSTLSPSESEEVEQIARRLINSIDQSLEDDPLDSGSGAS